MIDKVLLFKIRLQRFKILRTNLEVDIIVKGVM